MYRNILVIVFLCCVLLVGCNPSPYYQKVEPVPQDTWSYDFKPSFKFNVSDSNFFYVPYFIIRHTEAYPYRNIWLWMYTKQPGENYFHKARINIQLAESSGRWLGRGMGEIWEQRLRITSLGDSITLRKKGTYEIRFEQNMRISPLPEILNVGLRVEKLPRFNVK